MKGKTIYAAEINGNSVALNLYPDGHAALFNLVKVGGEVWPHHVRSFLNMVEGISFTKLLAGAFPIKAAK